MDSIFRDDFKKELKRLARPFFSEHGFRGRGFRLERTVSDEVVNEIYIQSSKWGDSCCVNLSTKFLFMNDPLANHAWTRLKPHGIVVADHWWNYDNPDGPAEIVDLLRTEGIAFFKLHLPFPGRLNQLDEKMILGELHQGILPSLTKERALLVLAKYYEYMERIPMCVSVAKTGQKITQGTVATGLHNRFLEMLQKYSP